MLIEFVGYLRTFIKTSDLVSCKNRREHPYLFRFHPVITVVHYVFKMHFCVSCTDV